MLSDRLDLDSEIETPLCLCDERFVGVWLSRVTQFREAWLCT